MKCLLAVIFESIWLLLLLWAKLSIDDNRVTPLCVKFDAPKRKKCISEPETETK